MPSAIGTVLIAALTSGVVALGIEWLFKPRLEARKERLLELHRKRRTFATQMITIMTTIAKWSAVEPRPGGMSDAFADRLARDRETAEQQLENITKAMNDEIFDVAAAYATQRIRNLVIRYIFMVRLVLLSDRSQVEQWSILQSLTQPAYTWLFRRSWRFISRSKAMLQLIRTLDSLPVANDDANTLPSTPQS